MLGRASNSVPIPIEWTLDPRIGSVLSPRSLTAGLSEVDQSTRVEAEPKRERERRCDAEGP